MVARTPRPLSPPLATPGSCAASPVFSLRCSSPKSKMPGTYPVTPRKGAIDGANDLSTWTAQLAAPVVPGAYPDASTQPTPIDSVCGSPIAMIDIKDGDHFPEVVRLVDTGIRPASTDSPTGVNPVPSRPSLVLSPPSSKKRAPFVSKVSSPAKVLPFRKALGNISNGLAVNTPPRDGPVDGKARKHRRPFVPPSPSETPCPPPRSISFRGARVHRTHPADTLPPIRSLPQKKATSPAPPSIDSADVPRRRRPTTPMPHMRGGVTKPAASTSPPTSAAAPTPTAQSSAHDRSENIHVDSGLPSLVSAPTYERPAFDGEPEASRPPLSMALSRPDAPLQTPPPSLHGRTSTASLAERREARPDLRSRLAGFDKHSQEESKQLRNLKRKIGDAQQQLHELELAQRHQRKQLVEQGIQNGLRRQIIQARLLLIRAKAQRRNRPTPRPMAPTPLDQDRRDFLEEQRLRLLRTGILSRNGVLPHP
ncbi:hypothetical protein DL93DRAFT_468073 [Clavulina sp. PMI_390]|nr:hypothetical protein DL93DRAFT_468073 [Clavulina sp. PMI_390]